MEFLSLEHYLSRSPVVYVHRDEYGPNRASEEHTHDFAEIFLVEKGRGHHCINGRSYRLEEGMLCIIQSGDQHSFSSPRRMKILNIAFQTTMLRVLEREEFSLFPLPESRILASLENERRELFVSLCHGLSLGGGDFLDLEIFLLELVRMLRRDSSYRKEEHSAAELVKTPWLRDFRRILNDPEELGLNVSEIARRLGISREHLSREVRHSYGKNPVQLITESRIRYACHLLRMTSLPVTEIAGRCGYESPARFFTCFKDVMGQTPGYFRKSRP